jgi:hypothetical protein
MKNKRGSHVGMILSFVIFITFIVFLYVVVRPAVTTGENKQSMLEYIGNKIIENTSTKLTSISIKIADKSSMKNQNCIKLEDFFLYSAVSGFLIVKNETGNIQNAYYDSNTDFNDLRINRENKNNLFFKIYYSKKFAKLPTTAISNCKLVEYVNEYNITSISATRYIFDGSMYKLIDYYKNDYEKLKSELNIPPGNEFGFGFTQSDGTKIEVGNAPESVNIYTGEISVQYIDDKANILSGFINVKVW